MEELLLKLSEERDYLTSIHKVPMEIVTKYIDNWVNHTLEDKRERLYTYNVDIKKYIAIDNSTDNCWVEEFENEIDALKWLGGLD